MLPGADRSEIYFIAAMMLLTLILSVAAVYIFMRQYKKEMREKKERDEQKRDKNEANGNHG